MRPTFATATVCLLLSSLLLAAAPAEAADTVGLVQRLRNTAYGTAPDAVRAPKQKRDGVLSGELIETADDSALEIGFVDGSNLVVGAGARVVIHDFAFDGDSGDGHAAITLALGAMRWITGVMPPAGIRLETPRATITVRGTDVRIGVRGNGDSLVTLDDGAVTVTAREDGSRVDIAAGSSVRVTAAGIEVLDSARPVADPVIDDGWFGTGGGAGERNRDKRGKKGD